MVLYNRTISDEYRCDYYYIMMGEVIGAFAYWLVSQQENEDMDIVAPIEAFKSYLNHKFFPDRRHTVLKMSYKEIGEMVSEDVFESIPEIMKINNGTGFIDLGALSRNIFFMILREKITQPN